MMKQNWQKPQLTVLVRGRPEENVLGGNENSSCKSNRADGQDKVGGCTPANAEQCWGNGGGT